MRLVDAGLASDRAPQARVARVERQPFFTPKGLAEYLSLSERTVRQMLADRRIASYRVEGVRRIAVEDVDVYLRAKRSERR